MNPDLYMAVFIVIFVPAAIAIGPDAGPSVALFIVLLITFCKNGKYDRR